MARQGKSYKVLLDAIEREKQKTGSVVLYAASEQRKKALEQVAEMLGQKIQVIVPPRLEGKKK